MRRLVCCRAMLWLILLSYMISAVNCTAWACLGHRQDGQSLHKNGVLRGFQLVVLTPLCVCVRLCNEHCRKHPRRRRPVQLAAQPVAGSNRHRWTKGRKCSADQAAQAARPHRYTSVMNRRFWPLECRQALNKAVAMGSFLCCRCGSTQPPTSRAQPDAACSKACLSQPCEHGT